MQKFSKLENCGQVNELYKCNCEACINMTKIIDISSKFLTGDFFAYEKVAEEIIGPVKKINNFLRGE